VVGCEAYLVHDAVDKITFHLPISFPAFKLGPFPHPYVHPTHLPKSHEHFATYVKEAQNIVYLPKLGLRGILILPKDFYLTGAFKLSFEKETRLLDTLPASEYYVTTVLHNLVLNKATIVGEHCKGVVQAIFVEDEEVYEVLVNRVTLKKRLTILVGFSQYCELILDHTFIC
jgi:hypothetical protein